MKFLRLKKALKKWGQVIDNESSRGLNGKPFRRNYQLSGEYSSCSCWLASADADGAMLSTVH